MRENSDKNDVCDATPIVTCFICCVGFILFAIFVSICIPLYVKARPDYDLTLPIVPGDYIKLLYSEKDYDSLIGLSLTISVDENYSTVPLELYQSACDDLNTREKFTQSNISITNCSRRCEVDRFLYFINSDQSVLSYKFTIETEGSEAKLMLFDDYYVFDSFLNGSDIDKDSVLQEVSLMTPYDHFVSFDLTKMTRPSYYFVAFQSINYQANISLNLFRQMTQVLWDNSSFSEACTFCDHSVYVNSKQCFILHINTAGTDVLPVHVHGGYSSTAILILIFVGGFIVPVCCCGYMFIALLLYILLCCCYNGCKVMMIARLIKHVISLIIINFET